MAFTTANADNRVDSDDGANGDANIRTRLTHISAGNIDNGAHTHSTHNEAVVTP
jgi:hypothetical protein